MAFLSRRFWLVPVFVAALCGCRADLGRTESVQACLDSAMDATGLHGGVMSYVDQQGEEILVRQGLLPLAGADAQLPMASLTKPLVADEIRRQIEAGQLRLDQPVAELLPFYSGVAVKGITVRHLLQHQAGYDRARVDPLFASAVPDCRQAAREVLSRPPEYLPGSQVLYSNAGYCVLGEVLLQHGWGGGLQPVLRTPLGAAGGWRGSVRQLRVLLERQLPLHDLSSDNHLSDGSYYTYGWRHWPQRDHFQWTHYGRLPGLVSIAASDGKKSMLVAHFSGDPDDYEKVASTFVESAFRCLQVERSNL